MTLLYKDSVLSSIEQVLRRVGVSRTFGPTYPGDDLRYPGVWFGFDEDSAEDRRKGAQFEDRMQEVSRVLVCQKGIDGEERDALDEVIECPIMDGDVALAVVKVGLHHILAKFIRLIQRMFQIHEGITLQFHPAGTDPIHVRLGETTAQDLNVELGPPLRVHYKEDDRMTIHSTSRPGTEVSETGCTVNLPTHDNSSLTWLS